jgi:hypothetical protein
MAGLAPLPIDPRPFGVEGHRVQSDAIAATPARGPASACIRSSLVIDADMNRGFEIPKASAEVAAHGIFDGLKCGEEEIFLDPAPQSIARGWRASALKAL